MSEIHLVSVHLAQGDVLLALFLDPFVSSRYDLPGIGGVFEGLPTKRPRESASLLARRDRGIETVVSRQLGVYNIIAAPH